MLLKFCAPGPSLWLNIELGISEGFPNPPKAAEFNVARLPKEAGLLNGSK